MNLKTLISATALAISTNTFAVDLASKTLIATNISVMPLVA